MSAADVDPVLEQLAAPAVVAAPVRAVMEADAPVKVAAVAAEPIRLSATHVSAAAVAQQAAPVQLTHNVASALGRLATAIAPAPAAPAPAAPAHTASALAAAPVPAAPAPIATPKQPAEPAEPAEPTRRKRTINTCSEEKGCEEEAAAPAPAVAEASRSTRPRTRTLVLPVVRADHRTCKLVCDTAELPDDILSTSDEPLLNRVHADLYTVSTPGGETTMYSVECSPEEIHALKSKHATTDGSWTWPESSERLDPLHLMWLGARGWMMVANCKCGFGGLHGGQRGAITVSLLLIEKGSSPLETNAYMIHTGTGPIREVIVCELVQDKRRGTAYITLPDQTSISMPYARIDLPFATCVRALSPQVLVTPSCTYLPFYEPKETLCETWRQHCVDNNFNTDFSGDVLILVLPTSMCKTAADTKVEMSRRSLANWMWRNGFDPRVWGWFHRRAADAPAEVLEELKELRDISMTQTERVPAHTEHILVGTETFLVRVESPGVYRISCIPPNMVLSTICVDGHFVASGGSLNAFLKQPICVNRQLSVFCSLVKCSSLLPTIKPMEGANFNELFGPGSAPTEVVIEKYIGFDLAVGDIVCARGGTRNLITGIGKIPQTNVRMPFDIGITKDYIEGGQDDGMPTMCPRWRGLQLPLKLYITRRGDAPCGSDWCALFAGTGASGVMLLDELAKDVYTRREYVLWAKRDAATVVTPESV